FPVIDLMSLMSACLSNDVRISAGVEPAFCAYAIPRLAAMYSVTVGKSLIATEATSPTMINTKIRPLIDIPDCLRFDRACIDSLLRGYSKLPIRFRLPRFIQMKNAFPTIYSFGTKPQ